MKREIKFRAWNIQLKRMRYPTLWDSSMPSNWQKFNVLQQFTGHTDKTGQDIYEGDIMEDSGVIFTDETRNLTVEFRSHEAGFAFKEIPNSAFFCVYAKQCKVIGNIYQTPELLP